MTCLKHAMVLAAGFGKRLRPITNDLPKALIKLQGTTLLDRALLKCRKQNVRRIVVNTHYLANKIYSHLKDYNDVILSPEASILETGGGVCKALPLLGTGPFFVVNSDCVWTDGQVPALRRLSEAWQKGNMDGLLLLKPKNYGVGYRGRGDFAVDKEGRLSRRGRNTDAPFAFMGIQILHPRLFSGYKIGKFSLNKVYDDAISHGRLFGLIHDGNWFHVSTPADLKNTERIFSKIQQTKLIS